MTRQSQLHLFFRMDDVKFTVLEKDSFLIFHLCP